VEATAMKRFYRSVCRVEESVAKMSLGAFTLLVAVAAGGRALGRPMDWAQDGAIFIFVWFVFFSADIAMRNDKLVAVTIITEKLPPRVQKWIAVVNYSIIAGFVVFMIRYSLFLLDISRHVAFQGRAGFSYAWVIASISVAFTLLLITTVTKLGEHLRAALARRTTT
jgi:TRAP-type C4-dicarboxylate transport system permease small subunit